MRSNKIYEWSQQFLIEVDDYINKRDYLKIVDPHKYMDFVKLVTQLRIKHKYKAILLLQLISGARISEVLSARKKEVNWETGEVKIEVLKKNRLGPKFKNKLLNHVVSVFLILFPLKIFKDRFYSKETRVKTRSTHIPKSLLPLFWAIAEDIGENDFLFENKETGKHYHRSTLYKKYMAWFGLTTHAIRHSRITFFKVAEGKDIDWIKDIFFFSDHKTIYRYINRSSSLETRTEADKIDKVLSA